MEDSNYEDEGTNYYRGIAVGLIGYIFKRYVLQRILDWQNWFEIMILFIIQLLKNNLQKIQFLRNRIMKEAKNLFELR